MSCKSRERLGEANVRSLLAISAQTAGISNAFPTPSYSAPHTDRVGHAIFTSASALGRQADRGGGSSRRWGRVVLPAPAGRSRNPVHVAGEVVLVSPVIPGQVRLAACRYLS
jgi:hypothetical protein